MPAPDHIVGLASLQSASPYACRADLIAAIRAAISAAGLSPSATRGAFAELVPVGARVLLKPNWVLHYNKSGKGMDCMITHPAFILAVVQELLRAEPATITIADAPIQDCDFDALFDASFLADLHALAGPCAISITDLRRTTRSSHIWHTLITRNRRDRDAFVLFDLGTDSLLEPIADPPGRFRNTNYDPRELMRTHRPGVHHYLLARELFEADVVINLPKLKTHRKGGITAALKNLVGLNGDKDFLPHHRIGGSASGGDCYPGRKPFKRLAEYALDCANYRLDRATYPVWQKLALLASGLSRLVYGDSNLEGEWYGNDTTWRMVLDLNRIALYGRPDGTIATTRQRALYTLTDALIAGEAFGPLAPEPVNLGMVTFAAAPPCADLIHAALMQFDWQKIALIREAFAANPRPLVACLPHHVRARHHNTLLTFDQVARTLGKPFRPPRGWVGHVELPPVPAPPPL